MEGVEKMSKAMAEGAEKLTYADYLQFPEDGQRHELIDGEHLVTPSPITRHQRAVGRLYLLLGGWVEERGTGEVFVAPMDVILSDVDVVELDLLFVSPERSEIVQDWIRGAPDLVVEVLSPRTRRRDEIRKRDLYERCEVREYWLVDPEAETVKVYRLAEGGFGKPRLLTGREEEILESPLLPGLEISVAELFPD